MRLAAIEGHLMSVTVRATSSAAVACRYNVTLTLKVPGTSFSSAASKAVVPDTPLPKSRWRVENVILSPGSLVRSSFSNNTASLPSGPVNTDTKDERSASDMTALSQQVCYSLTQTVNSEKERASSRASHFWMPLYVHSV